MERDRNGNGPAEPAREVLQEIGDVSVSRSGFSVFDGTRGIFFRVPEIPGNVRRIPELVRAASRGKTRFVPRFCGDRLLADFGRRFREIWFFSE